MFILNYFAWHYLLAPRNILRIWGNFLKFFVAYFIPIPQLLKTLFSPWKRDVTSYGRGFDFKVYAEALIFNVISRFFGAAFRSAAIIFALAVWCLVLLAGGIFFIFWIFWPFFLIGSFASSIYSLLQPFGEKSDFLLLIIFHLATIVAFGLFYEKSRQKLPTQMTLEEVFQQDWSATIWERLGVKIEELTDKIIEEPKKFLNDFLNEKQIANEEFLAVLEWEVVSQTKKIKKREFWEKENLFTKGNLSRNWLYGWTNFLDKYCKELPDESSMLVGRTEELDSIQRVLCRSRQTNALVVGQAGVGKKTVVNELARLVSQGKTYPQLAWRRILKLDLDAALAGLTDDGEIKERMISLLKEAGRAGNIILVIDNFHNFVSPDSLRNIYSVISPYLEGADFQFVALTSYEGLHNQIEKNPGLLNFFEKVEIKEPTSEMTLAILQQEAPKFELKAQKRITFQALKAIVKAADQYFSDVPMPEKAIDLLEETAIFAAGAPENFILPRHVYSVVSQKAEIPIGEIGVDEKSKLINLEEVLHQRVIGQELALKEVSSAMRRARLGVAAQNRPMGSFLFLGPTGVGKTETAKALAEAYFGSEKKMLRFDMSEYQGPTAVERIIGSSLIQTSGQLTTAVKENPFSLLLLDEIEKADPNILNLFLQALDEGWLTDALGRKINFRNLIIIATSNASAELIRQMVQQGIDPSKFKERVLDFVQQNGIFKPEFLNRFDGVVIFRPLSRENILDIAGLMLKGLAARLAEQDYIFNFGEDLAAKISELGYEPTNGARAMRRVIQNQVEDLIAKKILANEIQKRQPFEIKAEEI
ncbi:MAG: ATP-dependent Clp protease ATP-binding subunit [Candidatus Portnoybacteria bacterium]|nr:ATP-dependent Clp protease ATP-binding subunit [Candidatus Portnoybacteria bacterium]